MEFFRGLFNAAFKTYEHILKDGSFEACIDEQIIFSQLNGNANAVWSLLLATGYLKVLGVKNGNPYELGGIDIL